MRPNDQTLTTKNLDRLSNLLTNATSQQEILNEIPDGASIFHGSALDASLTEKNLHLASKILLGMILGYVEEAPLIMIYEKKKDTFQLIDLANELQKKQARRFISRFNDQNQQIFSEKVHELTIS